MDHSGSCKILVFLSTQLSPFTVSAAAVPAVPKPIHTLHLFPLPGTPFPSSISSKELWFQLGRIYLTEHAVYCNCTYPLFMASECPCSGHLPLTSASTVRAMSTWGWPRACSKGAGSILRWCVTQRTPADPQTSPSPGCSERQCVIASTPSPRWGGWEVKDDLVVEKDESLAGVWGCCLLWWRFTFRGILVMFYGRSIRVWLLSCIHCGNGWWPRSAL